MLKQYLGWVKGNKPALTEARLITKPDKVGAVYMHGQHDCGS